jgi:hypothetical protein
MKEPNCAATNENALSRPAAHDRSRQRGGLPSHQHYHSATEKQPSCSHHGQISSKSSDKIALPMRCRKIRRAGYLTEQCGVLLTVQTPGRPERSDLSSDYKSIDTLSR